MDMLQQLCIGGTYTYVENAEDTTKAFGSVLGSAYSTYYQNLKISVSGTNMNFTDDTGKPVTTYDIGDLYAEERKDLLLKASFAEEGPYEVKWELSGINIVDQCGFNKVTNLTIERGEDNTMNENIKARLNEILASKTISKATNLAKKGKFKEAVNHFRNFKTDCPILSRVMNDAEESMDASSFHAGGLNRVTSLAREVMLQRGTSENVATQWQKSIASALDENKFQ